MGNELIHWSDTAAASDRQSPIVLVGRVFKLVDGALEEHRVFPWLEFSHVRGELSILPSVLYAACAHLVFFDDQLEVTLLVWG